MPEAVGVRDESGGNFKAMYIKNIRKNKIRYCNVELPSWSENETFC